MEIARISASFKKLGAPAASHLDKLVEMETELADRQRKIEALKATVERLKV